MNFNRINKNLNERQIYELKNLYQTYHKQYWCYKHMHKKYKRYNLVLKLSSVVLTTTEAVVGSVTLNPIFLASVASSGVHLQTIITQKNFTKKAEACRYGFQSYQKLLNRLKYIFRSGHFDDFLERELAMIDDQVSDACPPISDHFQKLLYSK